MYQPQGGFRFEHGAFTCATKWYARADEIFQSLPVS